MENGNVFVQLAKNVKKFGFKKTENFPFYEFCGGGADAPVHLS